jgi:SsrA-binding protein
MVISVEIKNRKAYYDYFVEKEIETGIVLTGTEIKSIRKGSANLKDTYAKIKNNEVYLINMYIAKYDEGNRFNHDERRTRKLLLHKNEIKKIKEYTLIQGYTLIPLELYFKNNKVKIKLGVCKGKHTYDKRKAIKEKELKKEAKNVY